MTESSAASTPQCVPGYSPGWPRSLPAVQCNGSCGLEVPQCFSGERGKEGSTAVAPASPSYRWSRAKVCTGIIRVLLLAQHGASCSILSLSSSQIFALLTSDLGNTTQSQMLLFVPLQGFPSPMRNAVSCRALYSAEGWKFCSLLLFSLVVSGWWLWFILSIYRMFLFTFQFAFRYFQMLLSFRYVLILPLSVFWFVWQWDYSVMMRVFFPSYLLNCPACPPRFTCHCFRSPMVQQTYPAGFDMCWSRSPFYQISFAWLDQLCFTSYFSRALKFCGRFFTPPSVVICLRLDESLSEYRTLPKSSPCFIPVTELGDSKPGNSLQVHRWWLMEIQLRNFQLWSS